MIYGSVILLPNRIHGFKKVLDEIQHVSFDKIFIHICKYYSRLHQEFPSLELVELYQYLHSFPIPFEICFHDRDIGPCMKLFCMMDHIQAHDFVFIFDDDTILHPHIIEASIKYSTSLSVPSIIGCMGVRHPHFIHAENIDTPTEVRVLGGYRGVVYPGSVLKLLEKSFVSFITDILEFYNTHLQSIPLHDDHIFASFFRKHNIQLFVMSFKQNRMNYSIIENTNGIFQERSTDTQLLLLQKYLEMNGYEFN